MSHVTFWMCEKFVQGKEGRKEGSWLLYTVLRAITLHQSLRPGRGCADLVSEVVYLLSPSYKQRSGEF